MFHIPVHHRDEGAQGVEGGAGLGCVVNNVTSSACQDGVNGLHAVGGRLDLHRVHGLHQSATYNSGSMVSR